MEPGIMKRILEWIKNWFIKWEKEHAELNKPKEPNAPHTPGVPHIILSEIRGATDKEITMIHDGLKFLNNIIAGPDFKAKVLEAKFTSTNGLSNAQIYQSFCEKVISVKLVMYTGSWWANKVSKTVGYEDANFPGTIFSNRYFVYTSFSVASNLLHEVAHVLGYSHSSPKEKSSVPYSMSRILEEIKNGTV